MQDFTNFNQPQPSSADGYYKDPIEVAPVADEKKAETPAEPAKEEAPVLSAEETPAEEGAENKTELSPELAEYLETTKKLLEQTRKERNDTIVSIDQEEDKITNARKEQNDNPEHYEMIDYTTLNSLRDSLYRKNDLISSLIGVIRSIE